MIPETGIQKSIMFLWFIGICVWCPMSLFLWWHGHEAQTFAQASLNSTRLLTVSSTGVLWSLAGAVWLARLRKTKDLRARAVR
jgi:hypothetical protein